MRTGANEPLRVNGESPKRLDEREGTGAEGVFPEYHGPPNDAHITPVKEDPEAGIEAAAVEGKGGCRGATEGGGC